MCAREPQQPDITAIADRVLFGAAYYPEYFPAERSEVDLDLMERAGVTVIRVGESVWSTWEPRDGEFNLDWLVPTLDGAHRRGIAVILGTPTYAIPPWLQRAHPEIAAERGTGLRLPWGGRQEADFTNPDFRRHAERLIRRIAERYANHPAVIGFQLDNEPGLHLFHNDAVFERFVAELRVEFQDVEALNRAWGLVYWSHRLASFDELWRPDGNTLPQYDLAWRRFQARLTTEFIAWQAEIVRQYARPGQFVTTCLAYSRPALDDVAVARELDISAANLYYGMQEHLELDQDLPRIAPWTTTGVWGLLLSADRAYGTTGRRFLVTETNAQKIGASDQNYPPDPGQLTQAALALVSRGAAMIEYWHWNTIPYGTETFWGGVIPHSGRPGRVYEEVRQLGALLGGLGQQLDGYVPDHDITMVYSNASRWALDFFPPLPGAPSREHGGAYGVIFGAYYRGFMEAGLQLAILNDTQLAEIDPGRLVCSHPVLVVPALYACDDSLAARLHHYAQTGGHLVLGIRSLVADEQARIRTEPAPPVVSGDAGVWYEESSNLRLPIAIRGVGLKTSPGASATLWADGLIRDGAELLATYDDARFGRFAAVTSRVVGRGRITVIGTVPDPVLGGDLAGWLAPDPVAQAWSRDPTVTVTSGVNGSDQRLWFVHNWSRSEAMVRPPASCSPVGGAGADRPDDGAVTLPAYGVQIWTSARATLGGTK